MTSDLHRMYAIGLMAFIIFLSTLVSLPVLPRLLAVLPAFFALFVTFAFLRESHAPKQLRKTT